MAFLGVKWMGGKTSQLVSFDTIAALKLYCIMHLILKQNHKPTHIKKKTNHSTTKEMCFGC